MSEFAEVKTSELTGYALDWSVAKAIGYECGRIPGKYGALGCNAHNGVQYVIGRLIGASLVEELNARFWRPATEWAQCGPLLDEYHWALPYKTTNPIGKLGEFEACTESGKSCNGVSPLIAACRAIVYSRLGEVVHVPVDLVVVK